MLNSKLRGAKSRELLSYGGSSEIDLRGGSSSLSHSRCSTPMSRQDMEVVVVDIMEVAALRVALVVEGMMKTMEETVTVMPTLILKDIQIDLWALTIAMMCTGNYIRALCDGYCEPS